jgi:hypothetical protein
MPGNFSIRAVFQVVALFLAVIWSSQALVGHALAQDPVDELTRSRAEMQKAYDQLNNMNPLSADYQKTAPVTAATGPFADLNRLLSQPAVQGYLKFWSNPVFAKAVDEVMKHPNRNWVLYGEIGWVLFMLFLRTWRLARAKSVIAKVYANLWTFMLFWVGALILVPWGAIGKPYYDLVTSAAEVAVKGVSTAVKK